MKYLVTMLLFTSIMICLSKQVYADTSQGENYIFHMDVNTYPDQENQPYNQPGKYVIKRAIQPTPIDQPIEKRKLVPKLTPPPTTVEIGYSDNQPSSDFRFALSDSIVDFGPLSPTDFITRESTLTVLGDPTYRYSILAFQNHPLQNEKSRIISNTRCDDGNCTDIHASDWTDTLTFGFGYHCSNIENNACEKNFSDKDSYKTFSLSDTNQNGATIMNGLIETGAKARILYKINVPGTQAQGVYKNRITYIAVPVY